MHSLPLHLGIMADKEIIDNFDEECINYGYDSFYSSKEEAIPLKCWGRGIDRPPLSQLNIPKFVFEQQKNEMKMGYTEWNRGHHILDFGIHEDKWSNLNQKEETPVSMTEKETNCSSLNYSEMCQEEEKDYIPLKEVFSNISCARNSFEKNLNFTPSANTDRFILPGVYDGSNEFVITDEVSTSNSEVCSNISLNNLSEDESKDCDRTKYETQNNNVIVDFIKHNSCEIATSLKHKEQELVVNSNVDAFSKDDSVYSLKKVNMKDTSSHNIVNKHLTCSSLKNVNKFILPGVNEVDGEQDNVNHFDEVLTGSSDKYSNSSSDDCIVSDDKNSDYDNVKLGIESDCNPLINSFSQTNSYKSLPSQEEENKLLFINNIHVHNIEKPVSYYPLRSKTRILSLKIHERSSEPNLTALNVGKENKDLNSGNKTYSNPNLSDHRMTKYISNNVKCKVRVPNICETNHIKQPKSEPLHTVKALKYQGIINKFSSIPYRDNKLFSGGQISQTLAHLEVLEFGAVLKDEASYDKPTCLSQTLIVAEKSTMKNSKKHDSWEKLNTPFAAFNHFKNKSGVCVNYSRESDVEEINVLDDGSSVDYSGNDLYDCVEGSAGDLSAMHSDVFLTEKSVPVLVDCPKESSYLLNKEPQNNISGNISEIPKSVLNMKSIIQMVFAGVNKKSISDTQEVSPKMVSKGNADNILVIENLPEDIEDNDLKFILQQYGELQNFSLKPYGDQQIAKVQINGNLEWMIDCLNGSQPFGEEFKPIKCYKSN